LVVGAAGQLGRELTDRLAADAEVMAITRKDVDLRDIARLRSLVRAMAPAAILNAAAYNNVDLAEVEADTAFAVNAEVPRVLAEETSRLGALLVHYSTDYVFDGTARTPYRETSTPAPLNVYGESKLAGERAVAAVGGLHLIFRVAWLYGPHEKSFARMVLRVAREPRELRFVIDQLGSPTWSRRVAMATANILRQVAEDDRFALRDQASGLFHLTSAGATTRFDQAQAILALDRDPGRQIARIRPITSEEYGARARRPAYSVLDTSRVAERFGILMPDWRKDLEEAMPSINDAVQAETESAHLGG
jgi:dTDP-4-dehydrorhamnose reductase